MYPNYWNDADWVGSLVRYKGKNRPYLFGKTFKVVEQNVRGNIVAFYNSDGKLEWCAKASLEMVTTMENLTDFHDCSGRVDDIFIKASGGVEENIVNEIARLEKRLAELKSALSVIRSL